MKTWNDIKYLYYKIAGRFVSQYPQFQVDELVDEVAMETKKFWNKPANYLAAVIRHVMLQYIKRQLFLFTEITIEVPVGDSVLDELIKKEEIESMYEQISEKSKNLTLLEKIVLYFKYMFNWNDNEVGKLINRSGECARLIKVSALNKLKVA